MQGKPVLLYVKEMIAQITINRPDNRNSMDDEVLPYFYDVIEKVKNDKSLRCVIITGSGHSFCAGADFKSNIMNQKDGFLPQEIFELIYKPFLSVLDIEVPTIAAMNGHAIGGGLGLALVCDMRVANKDAKYGANFVRLGVHSGMAISYLMPRLVGLAVANELLFTGRLISGKRAEEIGLANYAVDADQVVEKAWEIAGEVRDCAPTAVKLMKRSVYRGLDLRPKDAAEIESFSQAQTFAMEDSKEGVKALFEKRKPEFRGK